MAPQTALAPLRGKECPGQSRTEQAQLLSSSTQERCEGQRGTRGDTGALPWGTGWSGTTGTVLQHPSEQLEQEQWYQTLPRPLPWAFPAFRERGTPGPAAPAGWGPRRLRVPFCSVRRIRPAAPPRFIQLNPAAGRSHPAGCRLSPAGARPRGTVPPRREGTEL